MVTRNLSTALIEKIAKNIRFFRGEKDFPALIKEGRKGFEANSWRLTADCFVTSF